MNLFHQRQSFTDYNQTYFHTFTIEGFKPLLEDDNNKRIVIDSLKYLVDNRLVEIYGYVIMPNHIHLLWTLLSRSSKENPASSFVKFSAHAFKKYLTEYYPIVLEGYTSQKRDRNYQFWKRDPLAIKIDSQNILTQKLDYIHNNPVTKKWKLCLLPEEYKWSSAGFYFNDIDEFNIVKHFNDDLFR